MLELLKRLVNIGRSLLAVCAKPKISKNIPLESSGMAGSLPMRLSLKRILTTKEAIIGELSIDGVFECFTLEHPVFLIDKGSYSVSLYKSPARGYQVPLLEGVPGRSYIEVHIGNTKKDTQGCILVGTSHDAYSNLKNSRVAFSNLLKHLDFPAIIDIT